MRKYLIVFIASLLLFGSCSNLKEIEVNDVGVESVKLGAKTKVVLSIEVDNPTGKNIVVKSFTGELLQKGSVFADVVLVGEPVVPARSVSTVPVTLELALRNPMDVLSIGLKFSGANIDQIIDQFTVNIDAQIKAGCIKKSIKLQEIPVKSIVQHFK